MNFHQSAFFSAFRMWIWTAGKKQYTGKRGKGVTVWAGEEEMNFKPYLMGCVRKGILPQPRVVDAPEFWPQATPQEQEQPVLHLRASAKLPRPPQGGEMLSSIWQSLKHLCTC